MQPHNSVTRKTWFTRGGTSRDTDRLGAQTHCSAGRTQAELLGKHTFCDSDLGQDSAYLRNRCSRDMHTVSGPVKFVLTVFHVARKHDTCVFILSNGNRDNPSCKTSVTRALSPKAQVSFTRLLLGLL